MLGPTARDQKPLPRLPQDAGVPVSNGGPELPIPLPYPVPISTIGLELHRRSCYVTPSPFAASPYVSGPSQVSEDPEGRIRHPFAFLHTLTRAPHPYCVSVIFVTANTEFFIFRLNNTINVTRGERTLMFTWLNG
jgi:hypothetical protein